MGTKTKQSNSISNPDDVMLTAKDYWKQSHQDMLPPKIRREDVTIVIPVARDDVCIILPHLEDHYNVCIRNDLGLANAIRKGIEVSATPIVVVADGDGTHQPCSIHQMVRLIDEGYDLVCGTRSIWPSDLQGIFSRQGNTFIRKRLNIPLKDATSGFFAARRDKLLELPSNLWRGYGDYYIELVTRAFLAHDWNIKSLEVDYVPRINGSGHTSLFKCMYIYHRRVIKLEKEVKRNNGSKRRINEDVVSKDSST